MRIARTVWPLLILVAASPMVAGRSQGVTTACKSNLKNIGTALEMYATDHQGHFPPRLAFLTPNYLKTIPTCPAAGLDTYSASYVALQDPDLFALACAGANHQQFALPPNSPAYSSEAGLVERPPPAPDLDLCQQQLQALGSRLAALPSPPDRLPADAPTCAGQPYLLAEGRIRCGALTHLGQGVKPFHPCYDGANGVVTRRLSGGQPAPRPTMEIRRMWTVAAVSLGILSLGGGGLWLAGRRRSAATPGSTTT